MLPFCKEGLHSGQKAASGVQAGRCFACTCIGRKVKGGLIGYTKVFLSASVIATPL